MVHTIIVMSTMEVLHDGSSEAEGTMLSGYAAQRN